MFNGSRIPVYISRLPAGSSAKDTRLFTQSIRTGRFSRYNYAPEKNMREYKSEIAPDYELGKITNKEIYLIRGPSDNLSVGRDVDKLRGILGSRIRANIVIPVQSWGHMAMLFGKEMAKYVNTPIHRILQRYS